MTHGGNVWQGEGPGAWLDYSANIRPEGMPEWVRQALRRGMESAAYYPEAGMERATRAMATYLGISPECVLPTAGGISAIELAGRVGRETVVLTPCFCEYEQLSPRPVRKVSLLRGERRIAVPEDMRLPEECLVWLCNPLNPVGCAFSREEVLRLLRRVEDAGGWLAVDEAFIEYCPEHSVADMVERCERLLVAGSLTKILGIPGVRLGYLCAAPRVLEGLRKRQRTWELNCFAEAVACALPEHREEVRSDARENARRRERLREQLEGLGLFVYPSQAAFLLVDLGRDARPVVARLKETGILVRECTDFDGLDDGRHLRLAVKGDENNARLIRALGEVLACGENR